MATLKALVDDFIGIASGLYAVDDRLLHPEQVKFWIITSRAEIIAELANQSNIPVSDQFWQDFGVLILNEVDKSESSIVSWNGKIKKTKLPGSIIPLPEDSGLWIGLADKTSSIVRATPGNIRYKKAGMFTQSCKFIYWYRIGTSIYVDAPCDVDIKYINARGLLQNPFDGKTIDINGNTICYQDTDDFPLPAASVSNLFQNIIQTRLGVSEQIGTDIINNAKDDLQK